MRPLTRWLLVCTMSLSVMHTMDPHGTVCDPTVTLSPGHSTGPQLQKRTVMFPQLFTSLASASFWPTSPQGLPNMLPSISKESTCDSVSGRPRFTVLT
eukprot:1597068-Pyramimonas_sp.AAC.1